MLRLLCVSISIVLLPACTTISPPPVDGAMTDSFHWRAVDEAVGWVVFLPGASGLTVLDDDQHYFEVAEKLNALGLNVLLIDYKPAYRAAIDPPSGNTGEKIAWVTEQAIEWMKGNRIEMSALPGAVVAWSLGAEGAFRLVNDGARVQATGIKSVVMYYPSIDGKTQLNNQVPLLVFAGELDDVTPLDDIAKRIEKRNPNAQYAELFTYANAHHGFDVASMTETKTIRLIPLVGPRATFGYNAEAANDAHDRLVKFIAESFRTE